jgi:hypothetical protein
METRNLILDVLYRKTAKKCEKELIKITDLIFRTFKKVFIS